MSFIVGLFLYFPEDKSEYLPAGITFLIFVLLAVATMRLIVVVSKKELNKAKEAEDRMKKYNEENSSDSK